MVQHVHVMLGARGLLFQKFFVCYLVDSCSRNCKLLLILSCGVTSAANSFFPSYESFLDPKENAGLPFIAAVCFHFLVKLKIYFIGFLSLIGVEVM